MWSSTVGETEHSRADGRSRNFSLRHGVQTGSWAYSSSYRIGMGAISPGVKRPGSRAEHSLLSSAEVKNAWVSSYVFMVWCLIKHRDNFTSTWESHRRQQRISPKLVVFKNKIVIPQWSRAFAAKLTVTQLFKKFPSFYGTWSFIFVFTRARHWSLSWAR